MYGNEVKLTKNLNETALLSCSTYQSPI